MAEVIGWGRALCLESRGFGRIVCIGGHFVIWLIRPVCFPVVCLRYKEPLSSPPHPPHTHTTTTTITTSEGGRAPKTEKTATKCPKILVYTPNTKMTRHVNGYSKLNPYCYLQPLPDPDSEVRSGLIRCKSVSTLGCARTGQKPVETCRVMR